MAVLLPLRGMARAYVIVPRPRTRGAEKWWDRLPAPLLAIAGERDERYVEIARRMGNAAIVPGAGHAAHLERPKAVAALLRDFLDEHLG